MELKPQRYRLSLVLNSFFFPLTSPDLFDSLRNRSFDVASLPPASTTVGPRSYISGHIAKKYDCFLDVDNNRKLIASEGRNVQNVVKLLLEVISLVEEDFLVDLNKEIDYLELISDIVITSDGNPIKSVEKIFARNKYMRKFGQILNAKTSTFLISLVPKGTSPSSRKWFEIRISPRLTMPNKSYYVSVVFRGINMNKILDFTKEIDSKILNLIRIIEET